VWEFWKFYQKSDAPPGGTELAARRQYSDVDACGYSGLGWYFRIISVWSLGKSISSVSVKG